MQRDICNIPKKKKKTRRDKKEWRSILMIKLKDEKEYWLNVNILLIF